LLPSTAQTRSAGPYEIQTEALNGGGTAVSGGAAYSQTASIEAIAGPQSGGAVYSVLSGFTAQLSSTPGTGSGGKAAFNAWQTVHFGGTTDPDAAAAADPDGDGISNLLEFMFNLDPLTTGVPVLAAGAGTSGLPLIREEAAGQERYLTIEYIRRKNSGTQTVQDTADLQSWSAAAFTAVGDPVSVSPVYERVKVRVEPALTPGVSRFVRLAITVD
jgi:hypothetical protein